MSEPDNGESNHRWKLFVFLSVATFFEGYDAIALTQILPRFREDMGISEAVGGALVAFINFGTIVAYVLVRLADRWGRRRVLTITIAGYTLMSFVSGLAPSVWTFGVFQLVARVFLIGEWAISMVYAAEEFPAERRGLMIGLISAFSALGSVVCAGLVPIFLEHTPWGWRTVYFVGTIPLILLAFARRSLKESSRFVETQAKRGLKKSQTLKEMFASLFEIMRTPYRKRVFQLALIWALTYMCTQTAVTFWKEYAVAPAPAVGPHLTEPQAGTVIVIAAIVSMPLVFLVGRLLEWAGRRISAVIIFSVTAVSGVSAFMITTPGVWMTVSVTGAMFGASAVLPVLNAFTTELFPTEHRGNAFAWSNNLLGRWGYVLPPLAVGPAAVVFGWGPSVAVTAIGPALALILILWLLPETQGKELEATAQLGTESN